MDNHSERIHDYLEGHLAGDDLAQFEERLKIDNDLRNLLALQKEVYEILNKRIVSEEIEFRSNLSTVTNNFRYNTEAKVINFKKIISCGAVACILIIGALFFFSKSETDLYELPSLRSEVLRGSLVSGSYERAIQVFNKGDYAEASRQFEILLNTSPGQIQYRYYLGLTYLGDKKWIKAIESLMPISKGISVFSDPAKYYLAITYYEIGDFSNAEKLLKELKISNEFSERANRILVNFK